MTYKRVKYMLYKRLRDNKYFVLIVVKIIKYSICPDSRENIQFIHTYFE